MALILTFVLVLSCSACIREKNGEDYIKDFLITKIPEILEEKYGLTDTNVNIGSVEIKDSDAFTAEASVKGTDGHGDEKEGELTLTGKYHSKRHNVSVDNESIRIIRDFSFDDISEFSGTYLDDPSDGNSYNSIKLIINQNDNGEVTAEYCNNEFAPIPVKEIEADRFDGFTLRGTYDNGDPFFLSIWKYDYNNEVKYNLKITIGYNDESDLSNARSTIYTMIDGEERTPKRLYHFYKNAYAFVDSNGRAYFTDMLVLNGTVK